MSVETVMELNPNIITRSTSTAVQRLAIRTAMNSTRAQDACKTGMGYKYKQADHISMQGGRSTHSIGTRHPTGRYGRDHFPGIATFPSARTILSETAREFALANPIDERTVSECVAWYYHRIHALYKAFIGDPAKNAKYYKSEKGAATKKRSRNKQPDKSTADLENEYPKPQPAHAQATQYHRCYTYARPLLAHRPPEHRWSW